MKGGGGGWAGKESVIKKVFFVGERRETRLGASAKEVFVGGPFSLSLSASVWA